MGEVRRGRRWAHGRRFVRGDRGDLGRLLAGLADGEAQAARGLLRRAVRATGARGVRVRPEEAAVAEALASAGVVRLEEQVTGTAAEARWIPWRVVVPGDAADEVREVLGLLDPDHERAELLDELAGVEDLAGEFEALRAAPDGGPLVAPEGSVVAGRAWSTYRAALRAAAVWHTADEPLSARELAARALGWSKAWTPARRDAFATLVGRPFHEALALRERFLRVRGPVAWSREGRTLDAQAARPWLGVPVSTVPDMELVTCEADGALVVENLDTFEVVTRRTAVPEHWVCVYGGGYVEQALVELLRMLDLPVAAWADLDAHGVEIVADLARRLGREVTPVGMDPRWLSVTAAQSAATEQVAHARRLAEDASAPLAAIAGELAERRRVVEQEAIHEVVLEELAEELQHLS